MRLLRRLAIPRTLPVTIPRRTASPFTTLSALRMASQEQPPPAGVVAAKAHEHANGAKRAAGQGGARSFRKKQKSKREKTMSEGSTEEVLLADVHALAAS